MHPAPALLVLLVSSACSAAQEMTERIARECASTAMIVKMHYAATAVLEAHGPVDVRKQIAAGKHLSTLAFSEVGSRSQFWAPVSTATGRPPLPSATPLRV